MTGPSWHPQTPHSEGTTDWRPRDVRRLEALDRHGPHAHHGDDFVIIHAPHVGYDPETETYGVYRRSVDPA